MQVKLVRDPQPLVITLACPQCGGPIHLDPEAGFICLDSCTTFIPTTAAARPSASVSPRKPTSDPRASSLLV